jgi:hypothetical protein
VFFQAAFFAAHRRWPASGSEVAAWLAAKADADKAELASVWRELRAAEALTKADFKRRRQALAKEKAAAKRADASRWKAGRHTFERLAEEFAASEGRPARTPHEVGAWAAAAAAEERARIDTSVGRAQEEQRRVLAEIRGRKRRIAEEKVWAAAPLLPTQTPLTTLSFVANL